MDQGNDLITTGKQKITLLRVGIFSSKISSCFAEIIKRKRRPGKSQLSWELELKKKALITYFFEIDVN